MNIEGYKWTKAKTDLSKKIYVLLMENRNPLNKVDAIIELIEYDYIPKSVIKQKIKELEERNKYLYTNGDINKNSFETIENEVKINTLKELLNKNP